MSKDKKSAIFCTHMVDFHRPGHISAYICITKVYNIPYSYIYDKMFEGENFHGFCGFLLTVNVLPLNILLIAN